MSVLDRIELPIDAHLPRIVELIKKNPVVIVEAEPGAGKTTRIPQEILSSLPGAYTYMTLPRRAAVPMIGTRIAEEMGVVPGEMVGWSLAREDPFTSDGTMLTLMVTQTMVNGIIKHGRLPEGVLIIDEAHERSIPIDLLLGLVKQYLPESPLSRVVVTSATIDTEKFSTFFWDAPVVRVEGRCFPVETRPYKLAKFEHHTDGAAAAAVEELTEFIKQGSVSVASGLSSEGLAVTGGRATEGSAIVLLPGTEDIKFVERTLRKAIGKYADAPVEILTLTSQSSNDDRNKVNSPVPANTLRFVLGTEVLRASVTVPGCVLVIDSLQLKRRVCNANGVGHLKKIAVSRAEAEQGKGRAGRLANGAYRPVVLNDEFGHLVPYPVPTIVREPVASVVLQIANSGQDVRTFPFVDAPAAQTIDKAVSRLQRIGLLDDNGAITPIGKELVDLPVDPELGMALVTARKSGILPETIIAVASLTQGSIFNQPDPNSKLVVEEPVVREIMARMKWQAREEGDDESVLERWIPSDEEPSDPKTITVDFDNLPSWITAEEVRTKGGKHKRQAQKITLWTVDCTAVDFPQERRAAWVASLARKEWNGASRNDFAATVRAWRAFMEASNRLPERHLRDWCDSHGLHFRRTQLVTQVAQQLQTDLQVKWKDLLVPRPFHTSDLTKALLTGLIDNLGVNLDETPVRDPHYKSELDPFTLVFQSAAHQACPLVLAGGVRRARSGNQVVDLAAPVQPHWLGELLPGLCKVVVKGNREEAYFNNLLVGVHTEPPLQPIAWPTPTPEETEKEEEPSMPSKEEPAEPSVASPPLHVAPPAATVEPTPRAEPTTAAAPAPPASAANPATGANKPDTQVEITRQQELAKLATTLYDELNQKMGAGAEKVNRLRIMRRFCTAPQGVDADWAEKAQQMIDHFREVLMIIEPLGSDSQKEPKAS